MTTVNLTSTLTITSNNNAKIIKCMKKLGVYQKILDKQLNEQKGHLLVDKDFFMWEEGDLALSGYYTRRNFRRI
jgi:hypothetical protein